MKSQTGHGGRFARRFRKTGSALAVGMLLLSAIALTRSQQTIVYSVLYSFTGGVDGANPFARLVRGKLGAIYGTTYAGGSGWGVVFELDPTGKETVLHSFTGGADGGHPDSGLIGDGTGNFYGTAPYGGNLGACRNGSGCGVLFELNSAGNQTVLYSFTGGASGALPHAGLIRDVVGNLYGTTSGGGATGSGIVFKLDVTGKETVLYRFTGGTDGAIPDGNLVQDVAGNLYGTTGGGGRSNNGVVFKIDPTGQEYVIYSFAGGFDGAFPYAGLVRDVAGNLYGTTVYGGGSRACPGGCGVVFRLVPAGTETVLHSFTGGSDGGNPIAGLVWDTAGNLYGTTSYGGDLTGCGGFGCGVVFKLDPAGKETVLYRFTGGSDGAHPWGGLVLDAVGNLCGTTYYGGASGQGVIFQLAP